MHNYHSWISSSSLFMHLLQKNIPITKNHVHVLQGILAIIIHALAAEKYPNHQKSYLYMIFGDFVIFFDNYLQNHKNLEIITINFTFIIFHFFITINHLHHHHNQLHFHNHQSHPSFFHHHTKGNG